MSDFERYLAVESAGGPSWHPEGNRITFTFNSPGTYQVYSVDITRGMACWPTRLSYEKDRCTVPRFISDSSIVFLRDYGGDENFQIGKIKNNGEIVWLTSSPQVKHVIDLVKGSRIYYNANIRDKSKRDAYCLDVTKEDDPELICEADKGVMQINCLSQDGKKRIVQRLIGNDQQEILLQESDSLDSLTYGVTGDSKIRWTAKRFIDKNTLLVVTDYKSDLLRPGILNLSGEFRTIPAIEENLEHETLEMFGADDLPYSYYVENREGYSKLSRGLFKEDGQVEISDVKLPINGTVVFGDERNFDSSSAISPNGKYIAVTMASPTDPSNIWILEVDTGKSWKATEVGLAGLNKEKFSDATLHRFKSFDNLSVPFFKFLPIGNPPTKGWPCIFLIHGGPESQTRPDFNPTIQFFVSAGFAVIAPNIRGSLGYGRKYLDMDNVEKRLDSIKDIRQLALHLKDPIHSIDVERLVVYGGSYGGFSVLSSMTEYPELWKAGVDLFGISNFVTFLKNTAPWRRTIREAEYGSLERDREILEKISPINKVDKIRSPLFIVQGDRDERVPLSESLQIFERVSSRGIKVKIIRFPDEGHGITKLENKIKAYPEILRWLKGIV